MKPAGLHRSTPALNLPQAPPPTSFGPRVQHSPLHPMHTRSGTCDAADAGVRAPQRPRPLAATQDPPETCPWLCAAPNPNFAWTQTGTPGAKRASGWGDAGMQEPAAACSIPAGKAMGGLQEAPGWEVLTAQVLVGENDSWRR